MLQAYRELHFNHKQVRLHCWPGILSNAGSSTLDSTGLQLQPGASRSFQSPPNWSGRFWARTGCNFDPTTGQGTCTTGDCGSNQVECNGAGLSHQPLSPSSRSAAPTTRISMTSA
ncbi:thaumatin-like protein 1b [Prunus yedoensis var. nudiflora]|uniref:Thaumatin-like protein 1b n=1 Tax=Prunus yedoensis var. nudiflora TaxID=2094558 RepID=A0A314ZT80_PRUYE|nr:thaumatin-like protein 1b [Prunus yedoensis var. nudiflora]